MRSIIGALLCWVRLHKWGPWHSYKFSDLERLGKPRTWRQCKRCCDCQDGPVCASTGDGKASER